MAPSPFILITLFSLATVAGIADARMASGQFNNWQGIAKDEGVVEAIEHLMHGETTSLSSERSDCHTSGDNLNEKAFVMGFEPRPNLPAYSDDGKSKREIAFLKDFEPRPSASAYPDMEDAALKTKNS